MRPAKLLIVLAAVTAATLAVLISVSTSGAASPPPSPRVSQAERASRDSSARGELGRIQTVSAFGVRVPASLPSGYTFDRVIWDPAKPQNGFDAWLLGPDPSVRDVHIVEAPAVANASKNTLALPGLIPVTLRSGTWHALQKPQEPWKGMWIFAIVQNGVHIEVDGPRQAAIAVAEQI
jgi:hypothetical protein